MASSSSDTAIAAGPLPHTAAEEAARVTVIEAQRRRFAIDWRSLWRHRELLYFLAWRDIKLRYKQTVFGAAWALLQPVLTMAILALFFGRLAGLQAATNGVPYPLYVFAGLLPWTFFANALSGAANSVVSSSNLVTKVYFPRLVIPMAALGVVLLDLLVSFAVLALLFVAYGRGLSWQIVLLPPLFGGLALFTIGAGTFLAALNVAYRDFRFVLPFLVQTWMLVTPVIYPTAIVPQHYRWLFWLNPVAGLVDGFRAALLGSPLPLPGVGMALIGSLLAFRFGIGYFRAVERRFADII
jgi:lipopolysaccharide transport system permease protein